MQQYAECHSHDYYSLLDGSPSPEEYMERAKELGITHLAQTNHGTLSGLRHHQRAAKEAGIIPILGVEAYISPTDMFDRRSKAKREDGTDIYNHVILLAMDETGLSTMSRLQEKAWVEGFYSKPRMDTELLLGDNDGLIVLSGCLNGLIPKAIERGDLVYAHHIAKQYKAALGDRFYIEVQGHNPPEMNKALLEIADKFGIKAVATSDCHYTKPENLWFEEAMLILSTNPKRISEPEMSKMEKMDVLERMNYLYPDRKMTFQEIEIYLRGYEDQRTLFARQNIERTDILSNTMEIANRIGEYPYHSGLDLLPRPERPANELLREKAFEGLRRRGLDKDPVALERLEYELGITHEKEFDVYFIVVEDLVTWAKAQGIRVGPGRGSGAGSLLLYCLYVTEVNPLEWGLIFERFLDPSRSDYPDVDLDFPDTERGRVKRYLIQKYEHVASIATFPTFKGKSAIRSASKALGVPIADVEKALKNNDGPPDEDYLDFFEDTTQGKAFIQRHPETIELARFLTGRLRTTGMHPAAVVLSREPLSKYMPIQTGIDPNDRSGPRVEYLALDMGEVESVGGIKIDILGLKNLRVIDNTINTIEARHGKKIDLLEVPLDDIKTYRMLANGKTVAVFQAEGPAFTKWIKETKCDNFMDIVNGTAISRPGAMDTVGKEYKKALLGETMVNYPNSIIHNITSKTLGFVVFQEQVMQMVTDLAGMSPESANFIRRTIAKKKDSALLEPYREEFVKGASKNISVKAAEKLWSDFEKHAGYSFNLSHAVAYSLISYWTAWLKANYPLEYMASAIAAEEDRDTLTNYLLEARRMQLKVYTPHAEHSMERASIQNDGIMLGLVDVKNIASKSAESIILNRPYGSYERFMEVVAARGTGVNSRAATSLDKIGGLRYDDHPLTGDERQFFYEYLGIPVMPKTALSPKMLAKIRPISDYEESTTFVVSGLVRGIKRGPTWTRISILDESGTAEAFVDKNTQIEEGKMYVMLISSNSVMKYIPMEDCMTSNSSLGMYLRDELALPSEGCERVLGFRSRYTKKGDKMGTVAFMTDTGELYSALVFPRQYKGALARLIEGREVRMRVAETYDGAYFVDGFE